MVLEGSSAEEWWGHVAENYSSPHGGVKPGQEAGGFQGHSAHQNHHPVA